MKGAVNRYFSRHWNGWSG